MKNPEEVKWLASSYPGDKELDPNPGLGLFLVCYNVWAVQPGFYHSHFKKHESSLSWAIEIQQTFTMC